MYSSIHTLYKITSERGQPLYKGQNVFGGFTVQPVEQAHGAIGIVMAQCNIYQERTVSRHIVQLMQPTVGSIIQASWYADSGYVTSQISLEWPHILIGDALIGLEGTLPRLIPTPLSHSHTRMC